MSWRNVALSSTASESWPAYTVTDWNVSQSPVVNVNTSTGPDTTTRSLPANADTATDTSPDGRDNNRTPYTTLAPSPTDTDPDGSNTNPGAGGGGGGGAVSSSVTVTVTSPDTV